MKRRKYSKRRSIWNLQQASPSRICAEDGNALQLCWSTSRWEFQNHHSELCKLFPNKHQTWHHNVQPIEFYVVLASTLNLDYGNILLATSSNAKLQAVIDNDWPFFTNNTNMVKECLTYSKCDLIHDIVNQLATKMNRKGVSREAFLHPIHLTPYNQGNLPPSALVPFCFYQGDSSLLGQQRHDWTW